MNRTLIASCFLLLPIAAGCVASEDEPGTEATDETAPEAATFSRDIVVTSGANKVVLTVSAQDPALLDRYDHIRYELTPMFERPAALPSSAGGAEGTGESVITPSTVQIDEAFVDLEPGAIGYQLRETGFAPLTALSCTSPNVHTSERDYARVTVTSGICTEAKISTRKYSWSWYEQKAYASALCPGAQALEGGKDDTNRVKLEICPGPGYTYSFYD